MPTVYSRDTGAPVSLPLDQTAQGLISGDLALDKNGPKIPLMGKDGQVYQADPNHVAQALSTGSYSLLDPHQELVHRVEKEEEAKGTLGSLKEAGSSALNQALLGVPEAITEGTETPAEKEEREARQDYHSTARILGGAVGLGGSLLAGGELFKGAELAGQAVAKGIVPGAELADAALSSRLASTAVNYATQGALLSSPQALVQAATGDPKQAAETLLWGVGAGALLGGAGELASSGAEALNDALTSPEAKSALNEFADKRTLKAIGAERSQLNKMSTDNMANLSDFAHEQGLIKPGMSREDIAQAIKDAKEATGNQQGELFSRLDGLASKNPDNYLDSKDLLRPGEISEVLKEKLLSSPEMNMPMNADQKAAIEKIVESADMIPTSKINGQEYVKFDDAQNFVSSLRKKWVGSIDKAQNEGGARGLDVITPLDQAKATAYAVAKVALETAADRTATAAEQAGDTTAGELVGALAKVKQNYRQLADLERLSATQARQSAGNRFASLTDFLHAGRGIPSLATQAIGSGIGGAIGGFPGAMVGNTIGKTLGIPLDFFAKKWAENKGLVYLSAITKRMAKDGPDVFGATLSAEARARLESTMAQTKRTVQAMASRSTQLAHPTVNAFEHLLGPDDTSKDPQSNIETLQKRLAQLQSNPNAQASTIADLSAPLSNVHPELANLYAQKLKQTLDYLHASLPPATPARMPFAPPPAPSSSPAQRLAFQDKAEIIVNPMSALNHVQQGTLSDAHLEALKTIYPEIYSLQRQELIAYAASHPKLVLPFKEQQSMAKFLGMPLDPSLSPQNIQIQQQLYQSKAGANPLSSGGASPGPRSKLKDLPSYGTLFGSSNGTSREP